MHSPITCIIDPLESFLGNQTVLYTTAADHLLIRATQTSFHIKKKSVLFS